ncbi:hypothetical protein NXS08_01740 [Gleimia sp. 6138-11-ORH1]|uniref:hypothetical protein n=1 Tax=Gleimia sp. 6138-11-ORH1 TaxID=2973937 RepID=UPI0021695166|nr:hypothetical protein [Gleimia sp. 6138-11-ORH1]MCS4484213.1 hypothetical protein [Gleimia sp. 6138-11-ORH1]
MFRRLSNGFLPLVGALAVAFSLSACSVHWDYGHPILPEISADEVQFQELVSAEIRFVAAAEKVSDCAACKPVLAQFVAGSAARQDALGGVWNPWPEGVPEGAPLPPGADLPAFSAAAPDLAREFVTNGFTALHSLPNLASESDRRLVASVALVRIHTGVRLAQASGSWEKLRIQLAANEFFSHTSDFFSEGATKLASAVRDWDCAVQVFPEIVATLPAAEAKVWYPRVRQLTIQLDRAVSVALEAKAADKRIDSCLGAFEFNAADLAPAESLQRAYEQLLLSTALAVAENPRVGKSISGNLLESSFTYAVLIEMIATSDFPVVSPLPGIVKANPAS